MEFRAAEKATLRRQTRHLLHLRKQSFHRDAVGDAPDLTEYKSRLAELI